MSQHAERFLDDLLHDADFAHAPAKEPSRAWRNLWRVDVAFPLNQNAFWHTPGERWGAYIWPSKDIAESRAIRDIESWAKQGYNDICTHLGAFPVEAPD